MFKKGTKLNSILTGACPKCQKESMYFNKKWFSITNILKMNERCSHCDLKYQIEPAFFFGAMYVNYGLNVALIVVTFIIAFLGFHANITSIFVSVIVVLIAFFPISIRLSRNIYINLFVSYNPDL
jgi:uncharacterized protein (DUF983 family)